MKLTSQKIFVFGSNLKGAHGAGAAKYARLHHHAKYGVGEGKTGNAYALPTKDENIEVRSLDDIKESIDRFIEYARDNPEKEFHVTRIGCGYAGFKDEQIAPLFRDMPNNCLVDSYWNKWLPHKSWGTF